MAMTALGWRAPYLMKLAARMRTVLMPPWVLHEQGVASVFLSLTGVLGTARCN